MFCARAKPIFLALIIRWNNFACRKLGRGLKVCSGKWISINNTAYNIVKSQLESAKEGKINIFLETTICVCCSNFLCVQFNSLKASFFVQVICLILLHNASTNIILPWTSWLYLYFVGWEESMEGTNSSMKIAAIILWKWKHFVKYFSLSLLLTRLLENDGHTQVHWTQEMLKA